MITKLPRWVEYGAFILATLAGTVNVVGLLGFQHQSVSHLSGTATMLGVQIAGLSGTSFHLLGILLSFLFGSIISGFLLGNAALKLGRHYDSLLVIEGLFLLLAIYMLKSHTVFGHYFASAACGLQNALATTYSGAIIRTTHVTGVFTDLGIMLGSVLRGEALDKRKTVLFLLIITGFILGGFLGSILFSAFHFMALLFPASACLILAASYRVYTLSN